MFVLPRRLKHYSEAALDFFFPRQCIGCGKYGDYICSTCARKLPRLNPPICQRCGKPEASGDRCPACWGKHDGIDAIRSVFKFEGTVRTAVHEFKYRGLRSICSSLSKFMAEYYVQNNISADVIVPVPLHQKRLKERGYNQSYLLAAELAVLISLPVEENLITRIKDTPPQARTSNADHRAANVRDAFVCSTRDFKGLDIIILDDVCTSGATIEACADVLKTAGAKRVLGFTFAREI